MTKKQGPILIILLAAAAVLLLALLGLRMFGARSPAPDPAPTKSPETSAAPEDRPRPTPDPTPTTVPTPDPTPTAAPTPDPTPTPTPEPTPEPTPYRPDVDVTSWEFILANPTHEIGEYEPELADVEGGQFMDVRVVDAMRSFIADARAAGYSVVINSSYRDYATQNYLYERKVGQYGGDRALAATIVAPPGTSEHQTGLCADIADQFYATKDRSLENTALFQWMKANCAQYGFILRYPDGKQEITGIMYEPWHFRYVGKEAAAFIMENGLTLEEFLALYGVE